MSILTAGIAPLCLIWFVLLVALVPGLQPRERPAVSRFDWIAIAFLSWQFIQISVFSIDREHGRELLQYGLTTSNFVTVASALLAGIYLVFLSLTGRFGIRRFLEKPYKPIAILCGIYLISACWAVQPAYSVFRVTEIAIYALLAIHVFTSLRTTADVVRVLTLMVAAWLVMVSPQMIDSLQDGLVFSSVKSNLVPPLAAIALILTPYSSLRYSPLIYTVLLAGFVVGGSAATLAFLLIAVAGLMLLSSSMLLRLVSAGVLLSTLALAGVYLVFPAKFPLIVDVVSTVLQKPRDELITATGRYQIWSAYATLSLDKPFGFGFGSERFIHDIGGREFIQQAFNRKELNLNVAHNAFLSGWFAAGWIGLFGVLYLLGSGVKRAIKGHGYLRAPVLSCLLLLSLNSMTTMGLATNFGTMWFGWIALVTMAAWQPVYDRAQQGTAPLRLRHGLAQPAE